jgi:hypothetical protein
MLCHNNCYKEYKRISALCVGKGKSKGLRYLRTIDLITMLQDNKTKVERLLNNSNSSKPHSYFNIIGEGETC